MNAVTHLSHLSWENFVSTFKPILNASALNNSDTGKLIFKPNSIEVETAIANNPECVWTLRHGDDGIVEFATNDIGAVNRNGFIITEVAGPQDNFVMVHDEGYFWFDCKFVLTSNRLDLDEVEFQDEFNNEIYEWKSACQIPILEVITEFKSLKRSSITAISINISFLLWEENPSQEFLDSIKDNFKSHFYHQCKNLEFISTYHFEPGLLRSYF